MQSRCWLVFVLFVWALALSSCAPGSPSRGFSAGDGGSADVIDLVGDGSEMRNGNPATCDDALRSHSYIGCDYWPTVLANVVWSIFDFAVVVANGQAEPATVHVTGPNGVNRTETVAPDGLVKIYLPWVGALKGADSDECGSSIPLGASVLERGGAYHLVSSVPVTVYQFNALEYRGEGGQSGKDWSVCPGNQPCSENGGQPVGCYSFTNDASLLLPTTALTGTYRITANHGWSAAQMGGYVAVTATQDGTQVTFDVSKTGSVLAGGPIPATGAGGTVTLSLDAGDVAELVSTGDDSADLSGSLLHATAPVQVLAGVPCIQEPLGTEACDHMEQTVFPAETLGRQYVVAAPTGPNGDVPGHVVRIYGNADGTQLTYAPSRPPGCPATIGAGDVADCGMVMQGFVVAGDHEFAVASFMLGGAIQDPAAQPPFQKGDPSQSLVAATEQYRSNYVFLAPDDYDVSYADIVVPDGSSLTLDGVQLTSPGTTIADGYSVQRVQLGSGQAGAHVLFASMPVGLQVIGFGSFTSYQYPGGLDLARIAAPPLK
jgi:hypothetical protein